ncbi:ribonuclease HII, putative [Acanthamoeba castellanii str. Neff]|uniref:Ribonuclease n=1 Tax=Acanthamoeba castellanii (strain ATCC 30010 / Neff) TaxID=1257118 RepID=L8GDC2_ACACF|nr:ribonuclease HII, putative [Acanthamoeba castellanii str. Neff]ELR10864.1 ribonuclease HII, putative [Acanthamoeba castellanii str. Neff]
MIYACAYCPVDKQEAYRKRGYRDSKDVKPAERDRLFAALLEDPDVGFRSRIVSAEEISNANYSHTENRNLNEVSYDAATGLNRDVLATGINLAELYVDALGNCATYRATLQRLFPGICTIVVESKADVNYPIVSVASIVAKTLRDGITKNLPFKECYITINRNYGNGYPSTPAVKDWLMRNLDPVFGLLSAVQFNWGPVKKALADPKNGVKRVTWEHTMGTPEHKNKMQTKTKSIFETPVVTR